MQALTKRRGCLWPMWPHDSRPTHEYCGASRVAGRPYCAKHYEMSLRSWETEKQQANNAVAEKKAA